MPKINLKPKSPEFADDLKPHQQHKACEMPGCPHEGTFRAPKDRSLSDHYWFCQMHITEYNRAWNFFDGMNAKEIEDHILQSMFGDRPTWRYDMPGMAEDNLRQRAWEFYGAGENPDEKSSQAWEEYERNRNKVDSSSAEFEALAIFGLEPPLTLDDIKVRYKELAKKYHPDVNQNDPKAEEALKQVNMAYTVLKLAFQKFDQLEKDV
ncbi:MAG: J domain-containing protein [Pseudomonadota bacterium]